MAEEIPAPEKEKTPPAEKKPGKKPATPSAGAPAKEEAPAKAEAPAPKAATVEEMLKEELGAIKVRRAKGSKNITSGVANVLASYNNTIVSITDHRGQVISWASAGRTGARGSRKSTSFAGTQVAQMAARDAMAHGLKEIVIRVSGPGQGRESAIRALHAIGLEVTSIVDVTPVPHNGCRPRKRRRV
jgi:small subunit ribosomal protein S11